MKKKLSILISILVLSLGIFSYYLYQKDTNVIMENNKEEIKPTGMNSLAIMLQNDKGEYELSDTNTWPTTGYEFNSTLSRCENGGELSWNDGKITLKTSGSDKCYVYFDKYVPLIEENIQLLTDKAKSMDPSTQGEFLQHTQALENSANDNGYRYSGNNPDNFICFGPGSKDYNEGGSDATCAKENKYRIIGIVPVTKADGTTDSLIKVIKSEYITKEELGKTTNDGTAYTGSYTDKKRVEADVTNLDGFYWNESSNTWTDGNYNYWSKQEDGEETPKVATLNESLNNDKTGYLSKLKKEDGGTYWIDKIETVQWNVGGANTNSVTPKAMKEAEESPDAGGSITSKAKIGLMYIYDYGFASAKDNWNTTLYDYNNDNNRNANWLFNGVDEWTISRGSSVSIYAFFVYNDGDVGANCVYSFSSGVRPVFYLKSNVEIKSDGATGSSEHPFKVQ